jgi:hypothetical protein
VTTLLLPPPITAAHQVDATLRERGHAVVHAAQRGHRDTLVITLRAGGFQGPGPDRYSIARFKTNP